MRRLELAFVAAWILGCGPGEVAGSGETGLASETGDGDGDPAVGDGDGEPTSGDGDGEPVGDGDGEPVGDGDGDPATGDGDGEPDTGDGDGEPSTGDGDGEPDTGDGDGEPDTGDGDGDEPLPDPVEILLPDQPLDVPACTIESSPEPACVGEGCPVVVDLELACIGERGLGVKDLSTSPSEVLMDIEGLVSDLEFGVRIADSASFIEPLPGSRYTGQDAQGVVYRGGVHEGIPAVVTRDGEAWLLATQPALVETVGSSNMSFRPVPNSEGRLEGQVILSDDNTSTYHWYVLDQDEWTGDWIDEADPNNGPQHIGLDASDRPYSLTMWDVDWEWFNLWLRFIGTEPVEVGAQNIKAYDMSVPMPPRPQLGGPPLAVLRSRDHGLDDPSGLTLLMIEDLDTWSEVELGLGELMQGSGCPSSKGTIEGPEPCPPCASFDEGVTTQYRFARTSGGGMWAAWIDGIGQTSAEYELDILCRALVDSTYTAVLHIGEFDVDGALLRSFDVELDVDYRHVSHGRWWLDMAAFDQTLAVTVQTRSWAHNVDVAPGFSSAVRILQFDTTAI